MQRIGLLFDCLRAPYDMAHIYQVATALGNCDLYLSGNCIDPMHKKVVSKVKSWGIEDLPNVQYFPSFEEAINELHQKGKTLLGTSPHTQNSLYSYDLIKRDTVIVFGTESTGLSEKKAGMLDGLVNIPMSKSCKFLTLPTAVPIVAYEYYRQISNNSQ
ncbi:MAG: TrmH family RNA methyltransferase [Myxococcota bacterium]